MGKDDGGAEAFYSRSRGQLPVQAISLYLASEVSDYPNGVQPFPVAGLPSYYLQRLELPTRHPIFFILKKDSSN